MPQTRPVTGLARPAFDLPRLAFPTVSIVICNHNYARYLQQAIDSALAQRPTCQVIVVDDGSTDRSRGLLEAADPRVKVVLQPNAGQAAAYNTGLQHCTGEVVIFLDADDALEPDAASVLSGRFASGVVKVHCRLALVDAAGLPLQRSIPATLADGDVAGPLLRHGLLYPSAPGSGNAYRRSVLERLFPLPVDADDKVGADFFTVYGVVAFGRVAACEAALVRYRLHRQPAAADLVFGNASLGVDEAERVGRRYAQLRAWLLVRTEGAVHLPERFLDFSVHKTTYALGVLARPYRQALLNSRGPVVELLRALWLQRQYGVAKKLGLTAWAALVLVAPRSTAASLARYVCNPAARAP